MYIPPVATADELGGIKVDQLLEITEGGTLSAVEQTDQNFTIGLKSKLEGLKGYTTGADISISEDGIISATGDGDDGGVNQQYVDQEVREAINRMPGIAFEGVGGVE